MNYNPEKRAIHKLLKVNRLQKSLAEKTMHTVGLHRSQHMLLIYLKNCATPPTQKEIAKDFDVTSAAVAMSLSKLEAKGLVERVVSETDKRYNYVKISEKGVQVLNSTREMFDSIDKGMFVDISESEIETITAICEKLVVNLLKIGAEEDKTPCLKKNKNKAK